MKVIYDFGANKGDNLEYYLLKSDLVVAVEANPVLCQQIRERFRANIENRSLVVENIIVCNDAQSRLPFFIHKYQDHLSQLGRPKADDMDSFTEVVLPSCRPSDIIANYGDPYYLKIDLEGADSMVLRSVLESGSRPTFVSVEAFTCDVFALLRCIGEYDAFSMVVGEDVYRGCYRNHPIASVTGELQCFNFPVFSAGPFGTDMTNTWLDPDSFARVLGIRGFGWIDIHASFSSTVGPPVRLKELSLMKLAFKTLNLYAKRRIREFLSSPTRMTRMLLTE